LCQRIAFVLLAAVFVFFTGSAAAFAYLEWWQAILASLLLFAGVVTVTKSIIRLLVRRAFRGATAFGGGLEGMMSGMFREKGRALHNATATLHSVVPTVAPATEVNGDSEAEFEETATALQSRDGDPAPPLRWFAFDVTVTPDRVRHSQFALWSIDDLVLVPGDAVVGEGLEDLSSSDEYPLDNVRLVNGPEPGELDGGKIAGPGRLRFTAGIAGGVRAVKFRYYFEAFGHNRLPDAP
jgi:hypothetical protein